VHLPDEGLPLQDEQKGADLPDIRPICLGAESRDRSIPLEYRMLIMEAAQG